jgi:mRNA interferase RelE/StbE
LGFENYQILIKSKPKKFLKTLNKKDKQRIIEKIEELKFNPGKGKLLVGNLAGLRRLRIGDFRVTYKILGNVLMIVVLKIKYRKHAYD